MCPFLKVNLRSKFTFRDSLRELEFAGVLPWRDSLRELEFAEVFALRDSLRELELAEVFALRIRSANSFITSASVTVPYFPGAA